MNDKHHSPGRPLKSENRNLVVLLLKAAESCLREKTYQEISLDELAKAADTTAGMISYYFGNKEGLFRALIEDSAKESAAKLKELAKNLQSLPGNPTRHLVDCLHQIRTMHAGTAKLVLSECHRHDSALKDFYKENYAYSFSHVEDVLSAFKAAHIYSNSLNVHYAALTIMSVITIHDQWGQVIDRIGFAHDELESEDWIDFVTDLFDRKFRDKG